MIDQEKALPTKALRLSMPRRMRCMRGVPMVQADERLPPRPARGGGPVVSGQPWRAKKWLKDTTEEAS